MKSHLTTDTRLWIVGLGWRNFDTSSQAAFDIHHIADAHGSSGLDLRNSRSLSVRSLAAPAKSSRLSKCYESSSFQHLTSILDLTSLFITLLPARRSTRQISSFLSPSTWHGLACTVYLLVFCSRRRMASNKLASWPLNLGLDGRMD